jgi:hypothetical protein
MENMDKYGFVRHLACLERYMTMDESMDSDTSSEIKEHCHNG